MLAALVIAFSSSGAATSSEAAAALRAAPVKPCTAHKAVRYYNQRRNHWRQKRGAPKLATHPGSKCPRYISAPDRMSVWLAPIASSEESSTTDGKATKRLTTQSDIGLSGNTFSPIANGAVGGEKFDTTRTRMLATTSLRTLRSSVVGAISNTILAFRRVLVSTAVTSRRSSSEVAATSATSTSVSTGQTVRKHSSRGLARAARFYQRAIHRWELLLGRDLTKFRKQRPTPYFVAVLQRKAYGLRRAWNRYFHYHYAWSEWLPAKWQRIGACETGYGKRPGSWTWDSGKYVSAFGIYRAGYTQFAHEIGQLGWDETVWKLHRVPTPREQFNVAMRIYYHYGFSGWGCRGA